MNYDLYDAWVELFIEVHTIEGIHLTYNQAVDAYWSILPEPEPVEDA